MVARHAPGSHVTVTVLHDKQQRNVDIALAALKDESEASTPASGDSSVAPGQPSSTLGIGVGDDEGHVVVQRVKPDGPSAGKLRPGDVIEEINRQPVAGSSDLAAKVRAAPAQKPVLLRVKRGDQSRYVAIEPSGR
jgi:serine protease Do